MRVASGGLADREADFALAVARRLEREADFSRASGGRQPTPGPDDAALRGILWQAARTTMLAGPPGARPTLGFDDVDVQLVDDDFGVSDTPLEHLVGQPGQAGGWRVNWPGVRSAIAQRLNERVLAFAAEAREQPREFNGRLLRLRDVRRGFPGDKSVTEPPGFGPDIAALGLAHRLSNAALG